MYRNCDHNKYLLNMVQDVKDVSYIDMRGRFDGIKRIKDNIYELRLGS